MELKVSEIVLRRKSGLFLIQFLFVLVSFTLSSCSYSFTGASISPSVRTISVAYLPNNALLVQPTLSRTLTETIRDKFISQSSLTLVNTNADLIIEGEITGYTTEPVAITGDQQSSALQRLRITVNIRFSNKQDPTQDFETSFTRFQDYDARKQLSAVEATLIDIITNEIAQDIFNKAVVNW